MNVHADRGRAITGWRACVKTLFRPFGACSQFFAADPRLTPLRQAQGKLWAVFFRRYAASHNVLDHDFVGAHHFVVFVFEDVAVPDVAEFVAGFCNSSRGEIELCDDAGEHSAVGLDCVFPGGTLV